MTKMKKTFVDEGSRTHLVCLFSFDPFAATVLVLWHGSIVFTFLEGLIIGAVIFNSTNTGLINNPFNIVMSAHDSLLFQTVVSSSLSFA